MGTTDPQSFTQQTALQNMIQMGTGSADLSYPDRATASGMSMAQSASIKRQKRTLMNFQNTFLIPMINKALYRKIQFDVDRYPVVDVKFVPYSTMGIMAKELEMQQMVQMLQAIPKDSPAFNVIMLAMFQNSSIHNRDAIVKSLMQGMQPNPQQQQLQQMGIELQMRQAEAEINKTIAEAEEEKAKAALHYSEAQRMQPNQIKMQEDMFKLEKQNLDLQKTKIDIASKASEIQRNIPEMEHLQSETALNLAKANAEANKVPISENIQ